MFKFLKFDQVTALDFTKDVNVERLLFIKDVFEQHRGTIDYAGAESHEDETFKNAVLTPLKISGNLVKPFMLLLPLLSFTHHELHIIKSLHVVFDESLRTKLLHAANTPFMKTYVHHYVFSVNNNYIGVRKTLTWLREIFKKTTVDEVLSLQFAAVLKMHVDEFKEVN